MRKTVFNKLASFIILSSLIFVVSGLRASSAVDLADRLRGRILIQTQSHGEAWYVYPTDLRRYYLGRPADAYLLMQRLSLGVTNADFSGWNGLAPARLAGRIILKTQDHGRAYYINPADLKLYYLGRPADAFDLMRRFGLGITDRDLITIREGRLAALPAPTYLVATAFEEKIHELINLERSANGLSLLKWNSALAAVAREHSTDLAAENKTLIDNSRLCSYPFIHHEGDIFGLYHNQRLNNRDVYYFSSSAENIALIPMVKQIEYRDTGADLPAGACQDRLSALNSAYETAIENAADDAAKLALLRSERDKRAALLGSEPTIKITGSVWQSQTDIENKTVSGWMASPGHRRNILNAEYDEAGVGVARVNDYFIITQVFIKRADCGYKDGACCHKSGYYPYCFVPLDCADNLCR